MRNAFGIASVLLACATAAFAGVSVSSPTPGATVGSPVHVVATATSSYSITAMAIYLDNKLVYTVAGSKIDTSVSTSTGSHYIVVQSWDSKGGVQKQPITVNVSSTSGGGTTVPSNAKIYADVDQMSGWDSCNSCAGPGGNGAAVPYSMTQFRSSPSVDGKSTEFWLGGKTPYAAALWWKQLGANAAVSNFVYDLYFYVKDPNASQALEFDLNQSGWGKKWIFGTQCDYRDHKDWDVWDSANRVWVKTGIACNPPQAYTWNHLTLEFQRTSNGMAKFIAVTLNGKKSYFNRAYWPGGSGVQELNVAFQMDGNNVSTNYSVWVDKIKLSAW